MYHHNQCPETVGTVDTVVAVATDADDIRRDDTTHPIGIIRLRRFFRP